MKAGKRERRAVQVAVFGYAAVLSVALVLYLCPLRIDGGEPALHLCVRCGFEGGDSVHSDCPGCRETARSRQWESNAAFQAEHLERRAYGLRQRYADKARRNEARRDGGPAPECSSC